MASKQLENYLTLLKIRQKGGRRNTIITGGIFGVLILAMLALGVILLSETVLYIAVTWVVVFVFYYLTIWVKLEIIKGSIELVENLLLMNED